jgi:hypothetical protein
MREFSELVATFFVDAYKDMVHSKGYMPWQLNTFIDLKTAKLVFQFAAHDSKSELQYKEEEPSNEKFLTFFNAYEETEWRMKLDGQKTDFSDVIFMMEHYVVDHLVMYGYDKNINFAMVYIPIE